MTSKEELLFIKFQLISNIENQETDDDWDETNKEFDINWWNERFQIIERDLEILELLKERIKKDIFGRLQYVSKSTLNEQTHIMLDQDEEKIRLWLEEKDND